MSDDKVEGGYLLPPHFFNAETSLVMEKFREVKPVPMSYYTAQRILETGHWNHQVKCRSEVLYINSFDDFDRALNTLKAYADKYEAEGYETELQSGYGGEFYVTVYQDVPITQEERELAESIVAKGEPTPTYVKWRRPIRFDRGIAETYDGRLWNMNTGDEIK